MPNPDTRSTDWENTVRVAAFASMSQLLYGSEIPAASKQAIYDVCQWVRSRLENDIAQRSKAENARASGEFQVRPILAYDAWEYRADRTPPGWLNLDGVTTYIDDFGDLIATRTYTRAGRDERTAWKLRPGDWVVYLGDKLPGPRLIYLNPERFRAIFRPA